MDTSVVGLNFSPEFAKAVEEKQIAEQEAQADIDCDKGKAEAQRLFAETPKAQGGKLVLQKEAIEAWHTGGVQMPKLLVTGGDQGGGVPFLFNLEGLE